MLELTKKENGLGYEQYYITTEEGTFEISFQGNLDLYWRYIYKGSILNCEDTHKFTISKENYFLYQLFEELYENIYNNTPFGDDQTYMSLNYPLVTNGIIDWHSDDFNYDKASRLMIEKNGEDFGVTFQKSEEDLTDGMFMTYAVRFRNSGSRYDYYNIPFMNMYNNLKNYDFDFHQIHMEEYLAKQKKLTR